MKLCATLHDGLGYAPDNKCREGGEESAQKRLAKETLANLSPIRSNAPRRDLKSLPSARHRLLEALTQNRRPQPQHVLRSGGWWNLQKSELQKGTPVRVQDVTGHGAQYLGQYLVASVSITIALRLLKGQGLREYKHTHAVHVGADTFFH